MAAAKKISKLIGFRGGLNLVDARPDESSDMLNMTVNQYGELVRRPDWAVVYRQLTPDTTVPFTTAKFIMAFGNLLYIQDGTALKYIDIGAVGNTIPANGPQTAHTFTTSAKIDAVVFNDKIVVVHPVDGVFDGPMSDVLTSRNANVKGTCITAWQNKLWVGGSGSRIYWSNAGSSATWTQASDFVDIREVDNDPVVAVHGASGMDVQGRAALLVFKASSHYRIHDSTTGAYTTLSSSIGAAGSESVDSREGLVVFVGRRGVFGSDANGSPVKLSGRIDPWFARDERTAVSSFDSWVVQATRGGFLVSISYHNGSTTKQDYYFELHVERGGDGPKARWFVNRISTATDQSAFISATRGTSTNIEVIYAVATSGTYLYAMVSKYTGGGDATNASPSTFGAFSYYWYSPWMELADGNQATLERMLLVGRGANLEVAVGRDWDEGSVTDYGDQDMTPAATTPLVTKEIHVQADPPARSHRIRFQGSSSAGTAITKPTFAGSTTLSEVAVKSLRLEYTQIER